MTAKQHMPPLFLQDQPRSQSQTGDPMDPLSVCGVCATAVGNSSSPATTNAVEGTPQAPPPSQSCAYFSPLRIAVCPFGGSAGSSSGGGSVGTAAVRIDGDFTNPFPIFNPETRKVTASVYSSQCLCDTNSYNVICIMRSIMRYTIWDMWDAVCFYAFML
jgi:hypothetical protein